MFYFLFLFTVTVDIFLFILASLMIRITYIYHQSLIQKKIKRILIPYIKNNILPRSLVHNHPNTSHLHGYIVLDLCNYHIFFDIQFRIFNLFTLSEKNKICDFFHNCKSEPQKAKLFHFSL